MARRGRWREPGLVKPSSARTTMTGCVKNGREPSRQRTSCLSRHPPRLPLRRPLGATAATASARPRPPHTRSACPSTCCHRRPLLRTYLCWRSAGTRAQCPCSIRPAWEGPHPAAGLHLLPHHHHRWSCRPEEVPQPRPWPPLRPPWTPQPSCRRWSRCPPSTWKPKSERDWGGDVRMQMFGWFFFACNDSHWDEKGGGEGLFFAVIIKTLVPILKEQSRELSEGIKMERESERLSVRPRGCEALVECSKAQRFLLRVSYETRPAVHTNIHLVECKRMMRFSSRRCCSRKNTDRHWCISNCSCCFDGTHTPSLYF